MVKRSNIDDNLTVFGGIRNFHWHATLPLVSVASKLIHINSCLTNYFFKLKLNVMFKKEMWSVDNARQNLFMACPWLGEHRKWVQAIRNPRAMWHCPTSKSVVNELISRNRTWTSTRVVRHTWELHMAHSVCFRTIYRTEIFFKKGLSPTTNSSKVLL